MMLLPHETEHKNPIGTHTKTCKFKTVKRGGVQIDPAAMDPDEMYALAKALVNFSAAKGSPVNGYALRITSETDTVEVLGQNGKMKEHPAPLDAKRAQKLIVAAEKAGLPITIEPEDQVGRDGVTYPNRYAGRIMIGTSEKTASVSAPDAATQAFLDGWG